MNPADTPFLPISPYVDTPADLQPALAADRHVDVAIIGGGLTGLSTALALADAGVEVVVLERHFCGFGASGRNAGHLTTTICKDLPTAKLLFGAQTAGELVRFADHCVEATEALMQQHGIDCDYHASGNIMAVVHPAHEKRLRSATEAAIGIGARVRFVEAGEMRERGLPRAFLCGALEEPGGTLHPGKLVLGLRHAALARGIRIHEQTRVLGVEEGSPMRVVTRGGTVSADRVVMAANAFTPEIGPPGERLAPLYVTLFETAPLSDAELAAIGGWPGREGVYTTHESLESYRLTARRTIIGGSKGVRYFYDCKPHNHGGAADAASAVVVKAFRERFPALAELPIAHTWSGWIGMTLNFLPVVGRAAHNPAYYFSVGYNGHGVAQASAMGALMADLMLGRPNPWTEIICRKPIYTPPRPLLWVAAQALLKVLVGLDERVDRRIVAEGIGR